MTVSLSILLLRNQSQSVHLTVLILLLSVASIGRKLLKTTNTEERSVHTNSEKCNIQLQLNGVLIGHSYAPPMPNYFLGLSSISASLRLKTGDQVTLFKESGTLNDDAGHWTHFTGWLVEEDLVLG